MKSTCVALLTAFITSGYLVHGQAADGRLPPPGQVYPNKAIRFVVPNAPGGGTDILARAIAHELAQSWGQPVLVDNRAGGTGAVGSVIVAKSSADGYALLIVTSSTHSISPSVQNDLPYDPVKDFAPISLVATGPNVMVVHPSVAANSVKELVALAKAHPGSLSYGSAGIGGISHMAAELFKMVTGINIVHIPYKGGSTALTDLLGGRVQLMFSGPGAVIQQVRARKLTALAVANTGRAAGLDDVPTFDEAGYPAVKASNWFGMLTTAGTPKLVVDKLNHEIVRIIGLPHVRQIFLANGYSPQSNTPEQFSRFIKDDLAKWQKVVKVSGVKLD